MQRWNWDLWPERSQCHLDTLLLFRLLTGAWLQLWLSMALNLSKRIIAGS
jgi:hypothetical protein